MCLLRGTNWIFIIIRSAHTVYLCFVWIWEQGAIIFLYSINWLVFITETVCVYCAVRTGSLYIILRSNHTVFMCFVWIWEQTAIISLYSINWLVFITETECVCCAVRTGSLYIILRSVHTVFMCFVWIWEQTAIISLYSINWLVFITETECVYCAVRIGSLYINQGSFSFEWLSLPSMSEFKYRVLFYRSAWKKTRFAGYVSVKVCSAEFQQNLWSVLWSAWDHVLLWP